MGVMADPKGQPYVHETNGWPFGPAIIPRDSNLGQRPSLLLILITWPSFNCLTLSDTFRKPDLANSRMIIKAESCTRSAVRLAYGRKGASLIRSVCVVNECHILHLEVLSAVNIFWLLTSSICKLKYLHFEFLSFFSASFLLLYCIIFLIKNLYISYRTN